MDRQILSIDACFLAALPDPVQEPICFAEGASRLEPIAFGYAPLQNSVLENTASDPAFTETDALSVEIGSVSVPVRIVERIEGRAFLLLELWNLRLEVDPSELAIPAACDGVPPPVTSSTGSSLSHVRDVVSERGLDLLKRLPATRRLFDAADR